MRRLHDLLILSLLLSAAAPTQLDSPIAPPSHAIPLWLKLLYTAFVIVLVPAYWWWYGPGNFLWFSDLALFTTLAALWVESPLLVSMQALSVGVLELAWLVDFLLRLLGGVETLGLSAYMFKPEIPLLIRGLSLFHVGMSPLLLWLVWRLGYDPRALPAQTFFAWVVLPVCYFVTDPTDSINWVFGPGKERQQWMAPPLYLMVLMVLFPLCVYLPTHLLLQKLFARP